jgi:PAS domain S-box-containing protein
VGGVCISLIGERARRALARSRAAEEALRESEGRFRSAIMAAPFPAIIHADDGQIVDVNRAWTEISGYTHADMPTLTAWLEKAYDEPQRSRVQDTVARLFIEHRVERDECAVRTASRELRAWRFSAAVLGLDGLGRRLAVSLAVDVTEQKRLEHERELLLHSERAARAEAQRANRMKDEFLAMISHELRTPLNAILGWTHLLRRPGAAPEHREHCLDVIERNTRLQGQLISDLLDVSRITTGKLHLDVQPVALPPVVEAAIDACRSVAEAKQVTLDAAIEPAPLT